MASISRRNLTDDNQQLTPRSHGNRMEQLASSRTDLGPAVDDLEKAQRAHSAKALRGYQH